PVGGSQICYIENADRYYYLNLTVSTPQDPQALDTLVFSDDNGHHAELIGDPLWATDVTCGREVND
ncbi:5824_t:CDS:2, partial [Racocetra persica]